MGRGLRLLDTGNVVSLVTLDQYKDFHTLMWCGSSRDLNSRGFAALYFSTIRLLILKVSLQIYHCLHDVFPDLLGFHNLQFTFSASGILSYFVYRNIIFAYMSHHLKAEFSIARSISYLMQHRAAWHGVGIHACSWLYGLVQHSSIFFSAAAHIQ